VKLGVHISIAGGVDQAIARAREARSQAFQIFSKNQTQWRTPPLDLERVEHFRRGREEHGLGPVLVHDSYLINLAAPAVAARRRAAAAFAEEVRRADALGAQFLVFHPGAHLGRGEAAGLRRVVKSLDRVFDAVPEIGLTLLAETTAGMGSQLGYTFEQLGVLVGEVVRPEKLGVCLDTCHVFAAGYELRTAAGYRATLAAFDRAVGLPKLLAFHLNDSLRELGSRVDRHERVGRGLLGRETFRRLVRDRRFAAHPGVMEMRGGPREYRADTALLRRLAGRA
jgi:deoxyribonuclease-4